MTTTQDAHQLLLETNRSIYSRGEQVKIVARGLGTDGSVPPPRDLRFQLEALDRDSDAHVDVRFQTGLDQAAGPIVLASFKSDGIPPGGYVIQAISDSDWGTNEAEILILDAERYHEYWQGLGREESVDYRSIER